MDGYPEEEDNEEEENEEDDEEGEEEDDGEWRKYCEVGVCTMSQRSRIQRLRETTPMRKKNEGRHNEDVEGVCP